MDATGYGQHKGWGVAKTMPKSTKPAEYGSTGAVQAWSTNREDA
jgi:hypothetical protein